MHKAWTGQKLNVSHFRKSRCNVWVPNRGGKQSKLAPKSKKMEFMGFLNGQKAVQHYKHTCIYPEMWHLMKIMSHIEQNSYQHHLVCKWILICKPAIKRNLKGKMVSI